MSKHYKIVLTIRFLGYLLLLAGIATFVFMLGPVVQTEATYRWDQLMGNKHTIPNIITSAQGSTEATPSSFGQIQTEANSIVPSSTEFGIVIEKINANARVVANVNPGDEKQYIAALAEGVAHAAGTNFPGEKGNIYLFSHSTDAPWNIVRFNAIFYLLRELEKGDRVVMFYKNKRYDYLVYDKIIAAPNDISYLTNRYDTSVLTLQTCDPPGTLLHRLIVRAKLAGS